MESRSHPLFPPAPGAGASSRNMSSPQANPAPPRAAEERPSPPPCPPPHRAPGEVPAVNPVVDEALTAAGPAVPPAGSGHDGSTDAGESHANRRAARGRRLKLSILTSLLVKPLSFVVPVVTVPLFLRYLGAERYGLYESIGALAAWLTLTDAGLGMGLVNRLTDCNVTGDRALARRYVSSLAVALLALVAAAAVALTVAVPLIDWVAVFPTEGLVARRETPWAVWAAGAVVLLGLAAGLPVAIYTAHQELYRNNLWDGAAKAASLLAGVAVVFTPFGLVGVVIAASGAHVLVRLANTLYLFSHEKPWLRPDPRLFDRTLLRSVLAEALGLFVITASAMALFQSDKLIIGVVLEPAEVTGYALVGRIFLISFGVYSLLIAPLWPAYGEAIRRGDVHWVYRALGFSLLAGCGGVLLTGIAMYFFGDSIVSLWTRGSVTAAPRPLVLGMTASFALWAWMACQSVALNAAGVLRPQVLFIGSHALLNLAGAVVMARVWGAAGVAWSIFLTGLLTSAWGYPLLVFRHLRAPAAQANTGTA